MALFFISLCALDCILQGVAGYTYLGQLVSHDMNKDLTSTLGVPVDPNTLPNANQPWLDLDTMYDFDDNEPELDERDPRKFAIGLSDSGMPADFPRDRDGNALIVDGRNDNNRIMAGIQVVR